MGVENIKTSLIMLKMVDYFIKTNKVKQKKNYYIYFKKKIYIENK